MFGKVTNRAIGLVIGFCDSDYAGDVDRRRSLTGYKGLVGDLGVSQKDITVFCDSQSTIHLTKNQMYHERTEHIDVRMHFIRDVTTQGDVLVEKIATSDNAVDVMTKALPLVKFKHCLYLVGITSGT